MAKYLFTGAYTTSGTQGLIKDGGSKRKAILETAVKALGGTLEAYYYAFGPNDVYGIADLPDKVGVASISLTIAATGVFKPQIVVLLTPEEIDQASRKSVAYSPPGQ